MGFIIPYQELLGNYNPCSKSDNKCLIIPYQELLGNYNVNINTLTGTGIIPYQELLGNYNYRADSPNSALLYHTKNC